MVTFMLAAAKMANLLLMFLLELGTLAAAAYWGFTIAAPLAVRILAGLGAPAVLIVVWAVFGAANGARIPLKGFARVVLEVLWFGSAVAALAAAGRSGWAVTFAVAFAVNAALRLFWKQ